MSVLLLLVSSISALASDLSLNELLELEVTTASRKAEPLQDAPGVMTVLTRADIERYGRRDLFEVLELVVGGYESGNILFPRNFVGFRGEDAFRANRVLHLINGRPLRRSLDGGYVFPVLRSFPIETIERIEIIRGPGSVLYGSTAYQGVVNIITRTVEAGESETTLSTGGGSFRQVRGQVAASGASSSGLAVTGGVSGVYAGGWQHEHVDQTNTLGSMDRLARDLGTTFQLGYEGLSINATYAQSQQNLFGDGGLWDTRTLYDHYRLMVDAGYRVDVVPDVLELQANVTLNLADQVGDEDTPPPLFGVFGETTLSRGFTNDQLLELTAFLTPSDRVNALIGGSIENQAGYWLLGSPDVPGVNIGELSPYSERWGALYGQVDARPIDQLKFVTGLQANKAGNVDWDVVPRLGAIAHFTDDVGMKLLVGQAFRASYQVERRFTVGGVLIPNPDLRPEKITTLDGQLFAQLGSVSAALTAFQSEQGDLIDLEETQGQNRQTNVAGTVVSRGVEAEVAVAPSPEVRIFGNVSATRFWRVEQSVGRAGPFSVPVPVRWSLGNDDVVSVRAPLLQAKVGASYAGGQGLTGGVFFTAQSASSASLDVGALPQADLEGFDKPFFDIDLRLAADVMALTSRSGPPTTLGVTATNLLGQVRYEDWRDGFWQRHPPAGVYVDLEVVL